MLCALAALGSAGCKDAPTDPMVGVVAEESSAALAIDVSFADPEGLVREGERLSPQGLEALTRWHESWLLDVPEGRRVRERIHPALVEAVAATARRDDVERELTLLGEGLRRADGIPAEAVPERLLRGLEAARAGYEAGTRALAHDDLRTAISELVRGGDALREVGPEAVARSLAQEVAEAFGRISPSDPYSEQDLERLKRLVHGSAEALEQGAWVLAIRRAYYARALLEAPQGG